MPTLSDFWRTKRANSENQKMIFSAPAKTITPIAVLPLIQSAENRQGFEMNFFSANGKDNIVKYKYLQRGLESDNINTPTGMDYCTGDREIAYLEGSKECNLYKARKFFISDEDLRKNEENYDTYFSERLASEIDPMLVGINKDMIAGFEAARGNTSAGTTVPLTAQGFVSFATREVNMAFHDTVVSEFQDLSYNGRLMMAAAGLVRNYANVLDYGGLNDKGQVVDMRLIEDMFAYGYDATLDAAIGTPNNALIWQPGSFQFLECLKNVAEFRRVVTDVRIQDTIRVQVGDMEVALDITIVDEYCSKEGQGKRVTIEKHYAFWNYDTDVFQVGDPLAGVNWLERFVMTAGA